MTIAHPLASNLHQPYTVKETSWGGRACFATHDMPKGSVVLKSDDFTGALIQYEFRKEVCHYCYRYSEGKTLKIKITIDDVLDLMTDKNTWLSTNSKRFRGAGLWFCSNDCKHTYLGEPGVIDLIEIYEILLDNYSKMMKRHNPDDDNQKLLNSVDISKDIINAQWKKTQEWMVQIDKLKNTKKIFQLPVISEDEYTCCRFVAETLYRINCYDAGCDTLKSFWGLQSNELSKLEEFPILLHFQQLVYKTLYILLPDYMQSFFSIDIFRHIMGSEYGNAFGIWQEGESVDNREFFGYRVVPRASYFNHSCIPNLTKRRDGTTMYFTLNRPVCVNEELNIDYSGVLEYPTEKRRKFLKDAWFFDCECDRCRLEVQASHKGLF